MMDTQRTFIRIRGTSALRTADVDSFVTSDDHIMRLPVHDSTPQRGSGLVYLTRHTSASAASCLVHQHAVRSRDEKIRGRRLVRGLAEAQGCDGFCRRLVHGTVFRDGGERCGA
jgi:hypothetical protein